MVLLAFHQQPESLQTLQAPFSGVSSSRESPTEVEIAAGVTKVSTTEMTGVPEREVHRSERREFARSERRLFTRSDRLHVKDFVTLARVHAKT